MMARSPYSKDHPVNRRQVHPAAATDDKARAAVPEPQPSRAARRLAGALWIAAGVIYVAAEYVASTAFPGYSYATNYISDLGVPEVGVVDGRHLDSPLSWVMNTGFVLQGVFFLIAALLAARALTRRPRKTTLWVTLSALHAFGIVLVAAVPGSQQAIQSGMAVFHGIGAAFAIICGNLAAAAGGFAIGGRGFRGFSIAIAVFGLLSLVGLFAHNALGIAAVADGLWERGSVYTIILWELVAGIVLIAFSGSGRPDGGWRSR